MSTYPQQQHRDRSRPADVSSSDHPASWRAGYGLYRVVRNALAAAMLLQIFLAFTPLTDVLQQWLDVTQQARQSDAILCLGGRDQRLIWAAELFHQGLAPGIVVSAPPGCAKTMRDRLMMMGVPADGILMDTDAHNTGDHPASIARVTGIAPSRQRFLIVTDAMHSRRVAACFHLGGYRDFIVYAGKTSGDLVTTPSQARWKSRIINLPYVAYEYAALALYKLQGRI